MQILKKIISTLFSLLDIFLEKFDFQFLTLLEEQLKDCNKVLDLGCGKCSPIRNIKRSDIYALDVDIFPKYIELSKKEKIHDDYLLLNIMDIDKKIPPKSFDCVLLLDVIEHLTKLEGINLIKKIEKIAKKKVIIFTPNGFLHQDEYHNNIYQQHKSGWNLKFFKKMQYEIFGINGLKFIRGEIAQIKLKPFSLWSRISRSSNLLVKYFPQLAFQLFCVKILK